MSSSFLRFAATVALLSVPLSAQGPVFSSPGLPNYTNITSRFSQTTRFSNEFNPAFGFVLDGFADYRDGEGADGFDFQMRLVELNASAYVDPNTWGWIVLTSEALEAPGIEEAAVEYVGFEGNSSLRVGHFFVDFGKQMQQHVEELRTPERPLVLREYLGAELGGTGVQYDNWMSLNDETPVRFSIGVFGDLAGGHEEHGEEEEEEEEFAAVVPAVKRADELSLTARLTAMTELGESSTLQIGGSARYLPEFAFEDEGSGARQESLSNVVVGLDATFGWTSDTGIKRWVAGGEWLLIDGDLSATLDESGATPQVGVANDSASGFYLFADHAWNRRQSAGVQWSLAESVEDTNVDVSEIDVYYTHHLTELRRLRCGLTFASADGAEDETRGYIQFTNFLGAHAHGINW